MATTSTLAEMAPQVADRLQDPNYTFWSEQFEVFGGLAEGISELLLMVGRPTAVFNQTVVIEANTVWQPMPAVFLSITNISLGGSLLKKTTLHSLDYLQASWGPSWESDRAATPARWAALGLNYFLVHPAPYYPIYAQFTGVAYPFVDTWPPNGTETSPFEKNINQALEMYSAAYCRLKECGQDAEIGFSLYRQFQEIGKRYSTIQDRRDDLVFTQSFGAPTAPSQTSKR